MDIQPGSKVTVTVKAPLRTRAAKITLARLFLKDKDIAKHRQQGAKPVRWYVRAGRFWGDRKRGSRALAPDVGDTANLLATVDVIRDLNSVDKYVELK